MSQPSPRRFVLGGAVAFLCAAACAGYFLSQDNRMTAQKVRGYADSVDFAKLSATDRSKAIHDLAEKVNALSLEERRRWRLDGSWRAWFAQMSEAEKGEFIDATLPSGVTQVINEFEDLPKVKREQTIEGAMKQLQQTHKLSLNREPGHDTDAYGTNGPPPLSAELEKRVLAIGLRTYYRESSAETKAELAPLLEELQHQMQNGRVFN
jgi:hypothetical protein